MRDVTRSAVTMHYPTSTRTVCGKESTATVRIGAKLSASSCQQHSAIEKGAQTLSVGQIHVSPSRSSFLEGCLDSAPTARCTMFLL